MNHTLLGPWVAIEQVEATMAGAGTLYRPWNARAPEAFIGHVLAIGTGIVDPPFEVGDFVLVEKMSGHPHMAGTGPDIIRGGRRFPGKSRIVDYTADHFGGDPSKPVGFVRFGPPIPACHQDEEAARRVRRGAELSANFQDQKKSIDERIDPAVEAEIMRHGRWVKLYEYDRAQKRRSRTMKPSRDPGRGEGIVAVITDAADLLRLGVDPVWLAETLGVATSEPDPGPT